MTQRLPSIINNIELEQGKIIQAAVTRMTKQVDRNAPHLLELEEQDKCVSSKIWLHY